MYNTAKGCRTGVYISHFMIAFFGDIKADFTNFRTNNFRSSYDADIYGCGKKIIVLTVVMILH